MKEAVSILGLHGYIQGSDIRNVINYPNRVVGVFSLCVEEILGENEHEKKVGKNN